MWQGSSAHKKGRNRLCLQDLRIPRSRARKLKAYLAKCWPDGSITGEKQTEGKAEVYNLTSPSCEQKEDSSDYQTQLDRLVLGRTCSLVAAQRAPWHRSPPVSPAGTGRREERRGLAVGASNTPGPAWADCENSGTCARMRACTPACVYTPTNTRRTHADTRIQTHHTHTRARTHTRAHTRAQPSAGLVEPSHICGPGRPSPPSYEVTDTGNVPPRAHGGLRRVREGLGRATCGRQSPRGLTGPRASHWMRTAKESRVNTVLPPPAKSPPQTAATKDPQPLEKAPPHSTLQGSPGSVYTATLRARKPCPRVSQRRKLRHRAGPRPDDPLEAEEPSPQPWAH